MPPEGFEHTIAASNWPPTHALDRAAAGIGKYCLPIHVLIASYFLLYALWHIV